jgi:lia operon protein LiaG
VVILVGAFLLFLTVPSWFTFQSQEGKVTNQTELIEIDVSSANTTIIAEKRDDVKAELDGKGTVTVETKGNTIKVEYKRKWYQTFTFFNGPKLTIYLPEDYNRDMDIDLSSGNLHVKGPLINIDQLSLDVSSGNINIESVSANSGTLDVSSGNIDVKHYIGALDVDVSSGNVSINIDQLTDDVKIDVSSGRASLNLPNDANFTLNGEVGSGGIFNSFPLKNKQETKQTLKGVQGTGEHSLDLSVSSGKIEIQ